MSLLKKVMFTALATFALPLSQSFAFEMTPLSVTLDVEGKQASTFLKLSNPHDKPKAIQVSMVTRNPDLYDDESSNEDAEDEFIVYPSQVILAPNSTKLCKVTYVGPTNVEREQAFRFIVDELDVNLSENQAQENSGVKLLMKYEGALYVQPARKLSPDVVISDSGTEMGEDQQENLRVTFHNKGNVHQVLHNLELVVHPAGQGKQAIVIPTEHLVGISGSNILAGKKREFTIPLPKDLKNTNYRVEYRLKEENS